LPTAGGAANINSPDVIRRFRSQFVSFDSDCRRALEGARSDVSRIQEWLRREQLGYWQKTLRKREELAEQARRDYTSALHRDGFVGKQSCVDEKKAFDRAMRLKAEAEQKVRAVKRWLIHIEREVANIAGACLSLSALLDSATPQALARLDEMLDRLDEYLRAAPGTG
jgi:hypothetical protein